MDASGKQEKKKRPPPPPGHGRAARRMSVRPAGRSPCLGIKNLLRDVLSSRGLLGVQVEALTSREEAAPTSRPCFCAGA